MSSLKCWLSKVEKQDKISKEDLAEILNLLDGHDKAVRADERKKIAEAILVDNTLCKEVKDILLHLLERYEKMEGVQE